MSNRFQERANTTTVDVTIIDNGGAFACGCVADSVNTVGLRLTTFGAGMVTGNKIWVDTVMDTFVLDRASVLVPNNITVAAAIGGGNWVRQNQAFLGWQEQASWFIDPIGGQDENDGATALTGLQTLAEWRRRTYNARINQPTLVLMLSNVPSTDPLSCTLTVGESGQLTFAGLRTVAGGDAGTFTAATIALNRATNQRLTVTDAARATWATSVDKIVTIVGGARNGAVMAVEAAIAANIGAMSPCVTYVPGNPSGTVQVTPVGGGGGDTYNILTLPQVTLGTVQITLDAGTFLAPGPFVHFDSLNIVTQSSGLGGGFRVFGMPCTVAACFLSGVTNESDFWVSIGGCVASGAGFATFAGGFSLFLAAQVNTLVTFGDSSTGGFDLDSIFHGTGQLLVLNGSAVINGTMCAFNCDTGDVITIEPGCSATSNGAFQISGIDLFWGTNNLFHAVRTRSSGNYTYVTLPTCNAGLGFGRETIVGGTDKTWAQIPYIETANNAAIVAYL